MAAMTTTLAIDCGGTALKGSVLDENGTMRVPRMTVATPYPISPTRFLNVIAEMADALPTADRATIGIPGMIRHGVVVTTPHYMTVRGPFTRVDPGLEAAWTGFDARSALTERLGIPTLVLNDAEVHGAGVVAGTGLELVLTLGTGLGAAMFDGGRLAPHLEWSQAPVRRGVTYDLFLGDKERRRVGDSIWSRRVRQTITDLRPVFRWDRVYLGGGNARRLRPSQLVKLGSDVVIVPNDAGVAGGVRAWTLGAN
jgi:polyphosphate glucokinase